MIKFRLSLLALVFAILLAAPVHAAPPTVQATPVATAVATQPAPVATAVLVAPPTEAPKVAPVVVVQQPDAPRVVDTSLIAALAALIGGLFGVVIGGGGVLVMYGRAIKLILNSPVIMKSLEELAKSWPAPVREAVADTGRFLEDVADDKPSVVAAVPAGAVG